MSRIVWKPGTMLYPAPAVMVSCRHKGADNIITVAWAGTVCTDPPMLSISLRPERYSHGLIKKSGVFAVNIPGRDLAFAVDFCGVKSGREVDKFSVLKLSRLQASKIDVPLIGECPLSLEAVVKSVTPLGSHDLFLAEVAAVSVEEKLVDEKGRLRLDRARLLCYSHGYYYNLGRPLDHFGFSVRKKKGRGGKGPTKPPAGRR
ncbi:MAG TPA: flavin reductase family protein [Spirochaetes bacterium]|nr:flavin reductase family protein [Spirochaetota bacterium]